MKILSSRQPSAKPDVSEREPLDSEFESVFEPPADSRPPVRHKAMDLLARREHSRTEMAGKLAVRGYADAEIAAALDGLVADGLISDARFAEAFIASRLRKGQGPVRIRMELKKRGVADDIVQVYLDEPDVDWVELAIQVRQRKFGGSVPAEFSKQARQMRFLEYRGFTSEQIRAAIAAR